jgi:hypothetical protein
MSHLVLSTSKRPCRKPRDSERSGIAHTKRHWKQKSPTNSLSKTMLESKLHLKQRTREERKSVKKSSSERKLRRKNLKSNSRRLFRMKRCVNINSNCKECSIRKSLRNRNMKRALKQWRSSKLPSLQPNKRQNARMREIKSTSAKCSRCSTILRWKGVVVAPDGCTIF